MTAVRGTRIIAIVLACLLAIAMAVIGSAAPSSAAAGEISGQVVDPALTGLDGLTVIIDDGSDPPAYQTVSTSGGGFFSYAPPADGDYDVVVLGGDDHLDYDSGPISYELATPASGDLGQIVLDPGKRITGIVRDAATGLPVEGVVVFATDATFTDLYPALPPTDATGLYSLAVPPGHDYYLIALDGNLFTGTGDAYDPQFWDHVNVSTLTGCSCMLGDPVSVTTVWPGTAITDIDFDLLSYSDWIYFSVYAERLPGPVEYAGITIHLDKWNAGTSTWDPMASDVTDADGYADLFGLGAGDYRIRYTKGSAALAVISYDDYSGGPFPLYGGGAWIEFPTLYPTSPGCGCGPSGFEEQDVDLLFPKPASGGSGGGTTTPPSTGRVVSAVVSATPTPTPTSTPSPSATPTSTPAPGPTSSAEPTPTPTPDPVPSSDADFPWWILLLIVLGLGILITIVIIVRRR